MKVIPYLFFDGQAEEAMEFYKGVLGGEVIALSRYDQMPETPGMEVPEAHKSKIMHAQLAVGDGNMLYFSDVMPGRPLSRGNHMSVTLSFDDTAKTEAVYDGLKDGAAIQFELQETFWSPRYGKLTDKYGVDWDLNCK